MFEKNLIKRAQVACFTARNGALGGVVGWLGAQKQREIRLMACLEVDKTIKIKLKYLISWLWFPNNHHHHHTASLFGLVRKV